MTKDSDMQTIEPEDDTGDIDPASLTDDERRELAERIFLDRRGEIGGAELAREVGWATRTGTKWVRTWAERHGLPGTAARADTAAERVPPRPAPAREAPSPRAAAPTPSARPQARHAARGTTAASTPVPLLVLTVAAVGTVAVVCAVVSWIHIRDLAVTAGMGSLSGWLPLGIDGLAVACTCSLIADRRQEKAGHPLAVAGLALGIGGSLVANVLAVDPELVPIRYVRWGLAGYPPLALAVSAHMLFRMLDEGTRR